MAMTDRKNPKRAASSESQYSLMEFLREFPDDDSCLNWLWKTRYSPDGKHADCPVCGEVREFNRYVTAQQRQSWTCTHCGQHVHPTAGAIFHKSSTSLHLWFYAMYLMTSTRCGISAKQLERELGVTYKTAWRMAHLIRNELMTQGDDALSGKVEMDETYVGGKPRSREIQAMRQAGLGSMQAGQAAARAKKSTVFGMVQRGGKVTAHVTPSNFQDVALGRVEARVLPATTVYTDEAAAYSPLAGKGYHDRRIQHAAKVYVEGDVHTNTIEGFWSLVKRGLDGLYHSVSAKHLDGYLNEDAWCYNRRNDGRAQFASLIDRAATTFIG